MLRSFSHSQKSIEWKLEFQGKESHSSITRPESCLLAVKSAAVMIHPAGGRLGLPRWGGREAGGMP